MKVPEKPAVYENTIWNRYNITASGKYVIRIEDFGARGR